MTFLALFSTECSCEFLPAPALADTIYQVTASGAFDSGAEVRAFDSTGRNETDVSLAGSTLSVTFDYDLNEAPADSFTPGSSSNSNLDSNSYVRNASPIFVSGTVTLGTQLDIPGALPIPSSFNLTATPGATDSNIAQTLRFTQAPGGLSSVLGTWSLSESFASGNTNYGYNWNIGFLCGSVTQIVPLGNYGASAPPPFIAIRRVRLKPESLTSRMRRSCLDLSAWISLWAAMSSSLRSQVKSSRRSRIRSRCWESLWF